MFYSPERTNNPTVIHLHPNPLLAGIPLLKFHFFAPFFILSIFQSPAWHERNSLAGSGEMLRRGGGGGDGWGGWRGTSPSRRPRRLLPDALPFAPEVYLALGHFQPTLFSRRLTARWARGTIRMCCARTFSSSCSLNPPVEQLGCLTHRFHLSASDWFNWRLILYAENLHFWRKALLIFFAHNINLKILHEIVVFMCSKMYDFLIL